MNDSVDELRKVIGKNVYGCAFTIGYDMAGLLLNGWGQSEGDCIWHENAPD